MIKTIKVSNADVKTLYHSTPFTKDHYVSWFDYDKLLMEKISEQNKNLIAEAEYRKLYEKYKTLQKITATIIENTEEGVVFNAIS